MPLASAVWRGVIGVIAVMLFPANNLAAVQVKDQVEVNPSPLHLGRPVRHFPTPYLTQLGGDIRARWVLLLRRLGVPAVGHLTMGPEQSAEGGFVGQINAFIRQHRHHARRKAGFVGHG